MDKRADAIRGVLVAWGFGSEHQTTAKIVDEVISALDAEPVVEPREVDLVIDRLKANLADPKLRKLPWKYGQCQISGKVFPDDHIWSLDGKTFARNAVNALPLLLEEIDQLRAERAKS